MFGNWAQETTTSPGGPGNINLTDNSSYPRFSEVFIAEQQLSYIILDNSGLPLEAGIGRYVSSNTLARDIILATFSSGVYDNTSPTAINLTNGVTYKVIAAPSANSILAAMPSFDANSTIAKHLWTPHVSINTNSITLSADYNYYVPFYNTAAVEISKLYIYITSAAVSGKARAVILSCKDGYPGSVLAETGDITITSTGQVETSLSSSVRLPPGWYFNGIVTSDNINIEGASGGSITNSLMTTPFGYSSSTPSQAIAYRRHTVTSGWTSFPAVNTTSSASTITAAYAPKITWVAA